MRGSHRAGLTGVGIAPPEARSHRREAHHRSGLTVLLAVAASGLLPGCGGTDERVPVPDREGAEKTSATVRAARRAYDGAPPTIPHENFGIECVGCHDDRGTALEGVGFAPPSPHEGTRGLSDRARCRQCHVFATTDERFVASDFVGLAQDLRRGGRLSLGSPPTIPHKTFMRENCSACHAGPAAREEIRTSHPERIRCRQCHVPETTRSTFAPGSPTPWPRPGGGGTP